MKKDFVEILEGKSVPQKVEEMTGSDPTVKDALLRFPEIKEKVDAKDFGGVLNLLTSNPEKYLGYRLRAATLRRVARNLIR